MPMFSMVGAGSLQERRWADALSQVGAEVQVVQHRTELGVCPADGAKPETGMAPAFPDCSGCCRWGVGSSRAMLRHSPGLEQAAGRCEQGGGEDDNKLSAVRTAGGGAAAPQGAGCLPNPLAAPQLCESVRHTGCFSAINRAGGKEGTPHDTCARNARARARRRRDHHPRSLPLGCDHHRTASRAQFRLPSSPWWVWEARHDWKRASRPRAGACSAAPMPARMGRGGSIGAGEATNNAGFAA